MQNDSGGVAAAVVKELSTCIDDSDHIMVVSFDVT
jgi:hypothetical protein